MESGSLAGAEPNTPDSYTSSRSGDTVRLARLHAMFGGPTPTKHTRSPASCRAEATIIISVAVYSVTGVFVTRSHATTPVACRRSLPSAGSYPETTRVPPTERGTRLAALLFTDIVGSTALADELGDRRWRELLARHHEVVRRALRRFNGREIDSAGDGFFAAFDKPADAVRCAAAIAGEVQALGIEIRAGLHV